MISSVYILEKVHRCVKPYVAYVAVCLLASHLGLLHDDNVAFESSTFRETKVKKKKRKERKHVPIMVVFTLLILFVKVFVLVGIGCKVFRSIQA